MNVVKALFNYGRVGESQNDGENELVTEPAILSFDELCSVYTDSFDNEYVAVDTITLTDVLTSKRLVLPCRSVHCKHLQVSLWREL